jgi:hypothetical protein
MRILIGFVFGMLTVAYTPELGMKIRALTNDAAVQVQDATTEDQSWQKLEHDTLSLLQEKVDDLRN